MPRLSAHADKILNLGAALAPQRGWTVAASARTRFLQLNRTTRLGLQPRGLVVLATATFVLDPEAPINSPHNLARALGAGLADAAMAVAGPARGDARGEPRGGPPRQRPGRTPRPWPRPARNPEE